MIPPMRAIHSPLAGVVLLLAVNTPGAAQYREPGAWLGAGVGAGVSEIACDGCAGWSFGDRTIYGFGGDMLSRRFGIGFGLAESWHTSGDSKAIGTRIDLMVRYRPGDRTKAFVDVGAGVSRSELWLHQLSQGKGSGVGFVGRFGYDVPVGHSGGFYLTPQVTYADGVIEQLVDQSSTFYLTKARHRLLAVGLGAGVRW